MPESGNLIYGAAFFAFATLFPKVEFLLFFILPVQVRFLAWLNVGVWVLAVLRDWRMLPFLLLGYAGYLIFAGIPVLKNKVCSPRKTSRANDSSRSAMAFHQCATCKRTDISHSSLEFRVASNGQEYCEDHLP
jgi:hypothetical protein